MPCLAVMVEPQFWPMTWVYRCSWSIWKSYPFRHKLDKEEDWNWLLLGNGFLCKYTILLFIHYASLHCLFTTFFGFLGGNQKTWFWKQRRIYNWSVRPPKKMHRNIIRKFNVRVTVSVLGDFCPKFFFSFKKAFNLASKSLLALTKQLSTCFEDFMNISWFYLIKVKFSGHFWP